MFRTTEQPTNILPTNDLLDFTAFQDAYKTYLSTLEQSLGPQALRTKAQRDIRLFPQLPLQGMPTQENLYTETEEFSVLQDESDASDNEAAKDKTQGCCKIM